MSQIQCPVSLGELVDKITILEIKSEKILDQEKLEHVAKELSLLSRKLKDLKLEGIEALKDSLKTVNEKLWGIEDEIRDKERSALFDEEFIQLARSVYVTNDKRFHYKNEINKKFNSGICEVKSYKKY